MAKARTRVSRRAAEARGAHAAALGGRGPAPRGAAGHPAARGGRLPRLVLRLRRSIRPPTCGAPSRKSAATTRLIVLRDISFESHCEHHMAPIIGRVHVGYLPANKVVGISKLARVVDGYARRFQVQEKLTAQIANCITEVLQAARRGRGGGRGAPVHDHARGAQAQRVDGHEPHDRRVPERCAHARGVPALHRHDRQPRALGPRARARRACQAASLREARLRSVSFRKRLRMRIEPG